MEKCEYCHSTDYETGKSASNYGGEIGEYAHEVGFINIGEKEIYLYGSTDVIKIDYCPFCGRKL